MLRYLKENGYPIDLEFHTQPYEEDDFHGYKSEIFFDGILFHTLIHEDFFARRNFAEGIFKYHEWEKTGKYKWRGKENPLQENGDLDIEVGDWIVDYAEKVREVLRDDDPNMSYEDIVRHATEKEVENHIEINSLLDKLSITKADNKSAWDHYGSELCAGSMINEEEAIENKIKSLR